MKLEAACRRGVTQPVADQGILQEEGQVGGDSKAGIQDQMKQMPQEQLAQRRPPDCVHRYRPVRPDLRPPPDPRPCRYADQPCALSPHEAVMEARFDESHKNGLRLQRIDGRPMFHRADRPSSTERLHPAAFLVVLLGAGMQRRAEANRAIISASFRLAKAGCSFLKSSKFSKTALTRLCRPHPRSTSVGGHEGGADAEGPARLALGPDTCRPGWWPLR